MKYVFNDNVDDNIHRMSKWLIGGLYENRHNGKQIRITESYKTDFGMTMFRSILLPVIEEGYQPTLIVSDSDMQHWDYIGEVTPRVFFDLKPERLIPQSKHLGAMYDSLVEHCAEMGYDISEWQEVWELALKNEDGEEE